MIEIFNKISKNIQEGKIVSAYAVGYGGIAESIFKMCIGNGFGFEFNDNLSLQELFKMNYCSFVVESKDALDFGILLGQITEKEELSYADENIKINDLLEIYEDRLEDIYNCNIKNENDDEEIFVLSSHSKNYKSSNIKISKPKVLIPVFPGTNCEYDTAKAFEDAGAVADIFVVNNLNSNSIRKSIEDFASKVSQSQIIFIPGGFSLGDEPDGSAKFITAFFRNEIIRDAVTEFLDNKQYLMGGICNGFQALIKLGLLPYGKIMQTDEDSPTITYNKIGRHQSKIVRTKIVSNKSPWLSHTNIGEIYNVAISHGEGRFIAEDFVLKELIANGQIATQYVDMQGNPTNKIRYNPNGATYAVEGITSLDGRIFGKMGHSERIGYGLYKNMPGKYDIKMFKSAVEYFK